MFFMDKLNIVEIYMNLHTHTHQGLMEVPGTRENICCWLNVHIVMSIKCLHKNISFLSEMILSIITLTVTVRHILA